jgi:hypothetical protein
MDAVERYLKHGEWTDPGPHREALSALPGDVPSLLSTVRGLLIHAEYLHLYGLDPSHFDTASRETLSVAARITQVLSRDGAPLTQARPPSGRSPATCRDYALLTCACLRAKGIAARVRCGFARYLPPGAFEDHWICEYWNEKTQRWSRADAQLDDETRRHFDISFNSGALPEGKFLSGDEAWRYWWSGAIIGGEFGHGEATGAWFLAVNLVRDLEALRHCEVSPWDGWRQATRDVRRRSPDNLDTYNAIAELIADLDSQPDVFETRPAPVPVPFWL